MRIKTIKNHRCAPKLPLDTILKKWMYLNDQIARSWRQERDVPWWYNERAAISIFAGAVWKSGNFAFEEFTGDKRKIKSGKLSRKYKGRTDIYFSCHGSDFIAESKFCFVGASTEGKDNVNKINRNLKRACFEIRKNRPKGQRRLGILFVCPSIRKKYRKLLESKIFNWIDKINTLNIDCDAVAWVFPSCARLICDAEQYYPGVVVFIKEIK